MFDFFKRKEPDVADALTNQTIGGQSVLYRLFREAIGCVRIPLKLDTQSTANWTVGA